MLPFFNMRNMCRNNFQLVNKAVEKMNRGELKIEDILDDDELVLDIKTNPNCQLANFFTPSIIRNLIDYVTIMPEEDDRLKGHKYPFNSCEILCSENSFIVEKIMEMIKIDEGSDSDSDSDNKKIKIKKRSMVDSEDELEDVTIKIGKSLENLSIQPDYDIDKKKIESEIQESEEVKKTNRMQIKSYEQVQINEEEHDHSLSLSTEIKKQIKKGENEKFICENLDYLYKFIESSDNDLNFVLTGYFSKIFIHLMKEKTQNMIKYIFLQKFDIINQLINHTNRKGICECIERILCSPCEDISNNNLHKIIIIEKLFDNIRKNFNDCEKISNTTDILIDSLANRKFYSIFKQSPTLLEKLYDLIREFIDNNDVTKNIIKVLSKINENILKDFGNLVTSVMNQDIADTLLTSLNNIDTNINDEDINLKLDTNEKYNLDQIFDIISNNAHYIILDFIKDDHNNTINTTYGLNKKVFGMKKIAQFEYIKTIIDIIINGYATSNSLINKLNDNVKNILETHLFQVSINYFFEFDLNNIYQKQFEQMIILITNKYTCKIIIDHIFIDLKFLDILIERIINNLKFFFKNTNTYVNSGFLPVLIEICTLISNTENVYLKEIIDRDISYNNLVKIFIEPIKQRFSQGLLYNLNSSKIITNFDKLLSVEYEFTENQKEDNELPGIPLKDIISSSIYEFKNGKKPESKVLEINLKEDLDDGFIKDREVFDPIFEIRDRSPLHKASYDEFFPSNDYGEEIYSDNNYWKVTLYPDEDELLKDL